MLEKLFGITFPVNEEHYEATIKEMQEKCDDQKTIEMLSMVVDIVIEKHPNVGAAIMGVSEYVHRDIESNIPLENPQLVERFAQNHKRDEG